MAKEAKGKAERLVATEPAAYSADDIARVFLASPPQPKKPAKKKPKKK